ncbi:MAG TPA: very short patch repair endonuclease [Cytophagales bacterium]|jgi:DNA mismatch endonuclease (patch repair protein)|nr:very short patch repair endonuclease [Cytophagales bacterium]
MSDTFSKATRSEIMRKIKSKNNNSTELKIIHIFKKSNITGWRRNYKITGNPDFVFPKLRIAVFTDGCFWHGHNCRNLTPKQNNEYWQSKITKNKKRDQKINEYLQNLGWEVIRIWECQINSDNIQKLLQKCQNRA